MTNLNEIKKILYKEKPIANFLYYRKNMLVYSCNTSIGKINFEIPVHDTGEASFTPEMDSKLLSRWILL